MVWLEFLSVSVSLFAGVKIYYTNRCIAYGLTIPLRRFFRGMNGLRNMLSLYRVLLVLS